MDANEVQGEKSIRAPSLARGLAILELLVESKRGLTLSEIARRLGLAKGTTHYLLATLRSEDYATCDEETGRYLPGRRFFRLSKMAIQGARLRQQASTLLRALHETTHLTVHLAVLDHQEVVLIEKVETAAPGRVATWVGKRMEMHCTGLGKAIMAHLSENELEDQIRTRGLPKYNENTLASTRKLRQELERIRTLGYALDDEEEELGFRCIAAPIFGQNAVVVGAISIAGTVEQVTSANERELSDRILETARSISAFASVE